MKCILVLKVNYLPRNRLIQYQKYFPLFLCFFYFAVVSLVYKGVWNKLCNMRNSENIQTSDTAFDIKGYCENHIDKLVCHFACLPQSSMWIFLIPAFSQIILESLFSLKTLFKYTAWIELSFVPYSRYTSTGSIAYL